MISGPASATCCITTPATDGPIAHAAFRVTLVTPLANVRSPGFTTAMTYDWRVGTSISTSASRARNSTAASAALLDAGAASGTLRPDVEPRDVMRVINGIWYLPDGPEWRADVGRMLDLVIDGLRYGVTGPAAR